MPKRILIVTSEMPPRPGALTAGGGLRVHSLAMALQEAGHEVIYSLHRKLVNDYNLEDDYLAYSYTPGTLPDAIAKAAPDLLLFEQWDPLAMLDEKPEVPVILDLPAPLLLEGAYRPKRDFSFDVARKVKALSMGDFFLCSNPRQKYYWYNWLSLCGFELANLPLEVFPISVSPKLPALPAQGILNFYYTGIFWNWQEPGPALEALLETIEEQEEGQLIVCGGLHPHHSGDQEKVPAELEALFDHPAVERLPMMPFDKLCRIYSQGGIGLEIMQANPERELSSSIRTINFLWAGLPVVIGNYSYLAPMVDEYQAGWVVDTSSREELKKVYQSILNNPDGLLRRGANAQRLVREHFTWDRNIKILLPFIENPQPANRTTGALEPVAQLELELRELTSERDHYEREYHAAQHRFTTTSIELQNIRNKKLFKLFKKIKKIFSQE